MCTPVRHIYLFGLYGHNDVSSGTSGSSGPSGPSGSSGSSGQAGPSGIGFPDASRLQDLGPRLRVSVCLVPLLFTNSRNIAYSPYVVLYYDWILIFFIISGIFDVMFRNHVGTTSHSVVPTGEARLLVTVSLVLGAIFRTV